MVQDNVLFISDNIRFTSGCVLPLNVCDETSESEIVYSNKNECPWSLIGGSGSQNNLLAPNVKGYRLEYGPCMVACRLNQKNHQFDKIFVLPSLRRYNSFPLLRRDTFEEMTNCVRSI